MYKAKNVTNVLTFNSLMFFNIGGPTARGCRARSKMSNDQWIEVYGGLRNTGSDGAETYDARVTNSEGETIRVMGYPPVLRNATPDDITCMMVHSQQHTRVWKKRKPVTSGRSYTRTRR